MVVVSATAMYHQTFQLWRFERRNRTSSLDVPSQGNSLVRERWAKSARTGPVFTRWNHSRGDIPGPSDLSYTPTSPPATTFFHYSLGPSVFSIPAFFTRQLLWNLWIRRSSSLVPSRPNRFNACRIARCLWSFLGSRATSSRKPKLLGKNSVIDLWVIDSVDSFR